MQKSIPLILAAVSAVSGCSMLSSRPVTKVSEPNYRVVERDLASKPALRAARVVDSSLLRPSSSAPQRAPSKTPDATPAGNPPRVMAAKEVAPSVAANAAQGPAAAASGTSSGTVPARGTRPAVRRWEVRVGDVRLAATFERWAKEAAEQGTAYTILWDADKHVLIDSTPAYSGSLLDAIEQALKSPAILNGPYPLEACVYDNEPPLVRITKQGEQAKDCPVFR